MTPLISFEFLPPATDYEEAHLDYEAVTGGEIVRWPLLGATIILPKSWGALNEIEEYNNGNFKAHGQSGFSVGGYHEFLLSMWKENFGYFKMGNIEATFGQASPLAAAPFHPYHTKYHNPWESIISLRIRGVGVDEVEAAFLNAWSAFERKFGEVPKLYPVRV